MESMIIEKLKLISTKMGGICLSSAYVNSKTKLLFRCSAGHEWEAIPSSIIKGHWCKICGNINQGKKKSLSIEDMMELAKSKGGQCLSSEYKNNTSPLTWQCSKGHIWTAPGGTIRNQGSWCPKCFGKDKEVNLKTLQEISIAKGGRCLAHTYKKAHEKLEFECKLGHKWMASATSIKSGTWCQKCHNINIGSEENGITLDFLNSIAKRKGGKMISNNYINSGLPIEWECANGHRWFAKYDHIKKDSWCPICSSGISENVTRLILEHITQKQFPKKKPTWLLSESGSRLELDGFNEEINIAFEYNGVQHYQFNKRFHNNLIDLEKRIADDIHKQNLCKKNGVFLIIVKYDIPKESIFQFVLNQLRKHPEHIHIIQKSDEIDFRDLDTWKKNEIIKMQRIAETKEGLCLSENYLGNKTKLIWKCKFEHIWEANPSDIKSGKWCPACRGQDKKVNYDFILEKVKEKGGKCISKEYSDAKTKLLLECAKGHRWEANFTSIKSGFWCSECRHLFKKHKNNKYTLDTFKKIAISKQGICLSTDYRNTDSRLNFKCLNGHEWTTTAWVILKGSWCKKCAHSNSIKSIIKS
jgi:hypothetical protein